MNMTPQEFATARDELLRWTIAQQSSLRTRVQHGDQTTQQPVTWRCPNPDCLPSVLDSWFDFESEYPKCPKCGLEPPAIQKRVLIHFVVRDTKGQIVGQNGLRYRVACAPRIAVIATATNGEAGTNDLTQVNCPGCMLSDEFRSGVTSGLSLHQQPQ